MSDTTQNSFALTNTCVIGPSGEQLTETDGSGNWLHTNVYAAGQLLATYSYIDSSHTTTDTYFALSDWLGTKRAVVSAGGCGTGYIGLPYGDSLTATGLPGFTQCPDATEHHFTGKERDAESGLDYFGARYYASSMGRFMNPDWADKPEDVPYSDLHNPQSLNLYAYVGNNPLGRTDADGHLYNGTLGELAGELSLLMEPSMIVEEQEEHKNQVLQAEDAQSAQQQSGSGWTSEKPTSGDYVTVSDYSKSAGGFHHTGLAVDSDNTQGFSTKDPTTPWWQRLFGAPQGGMENDLKMHTSPDGEVAPHSYLYRSITSDQAAGFGEQSMPEADRAVQGDTT